MSAPDFVKNSPLAITEGELRHGGRIDVDKHSMIHKRHANVIALGDASGPWLDPSVDRGMWWVL